MAMLGGLPWVWIAGGWHAKDTLGKEVDIRRLPCKGVGKTSAEVLPSSGDRLPLLRRTLRCTGTHWTHRCPSPGPGNQGRPAP